MSSELQPVWTPSASRIEASAMYAFRQFVEKRFALNFSGTAALHEWSIAQPAEFWEAIWDFAGVTGTKGERRIVNGNQMPGARFFPMLR